MKKRKDLHSNSNEGGYSLVELLISLTIILVLAGVSIPNYMAARARANEASAASSVRAIVSAQNLYRNTYGNFAHLSSLGEEYLTDDRLSSGFKSGYNFISEPGTSPALEFSVEASPALSLGYSATGNRTYFGDETAIVRSALMAAADVSSPPLQ
jgi:prepilin-type N-terminal cleavage/methylation domain-containing protein